MRWWPRCAAQCSGLGWTPTRRSWTAGTPLIVSGNLATRSTRTHGSWVVSPPRWRSPTHELVAQGPHTSDIHNSARKPGAVPDMFEVTWFEVNEDLHWGGCNQVPRSMRACQGIAHALNSGYFGDGRTHRRVTTPGLALSEHLRWFMSGVKSISSGQTFALVGLVYTNPCLSQGSVAEFILSLA